MAVTGPFTRSGMVLRKERSGRHEKELNAWIATATKRTTATAPSKCLRLRGRIWVPLCAALDCVRGRPGSALEKESGPRL